VVEDPFIKESKPIITFENSDLFDVNNKNPRFLGGTRSHYKLLVVHSCCFCDIPDDAIRYSKLINAVVSMTL
jgi:hypothetical protein